MKIRLSMPNIGYKVDIRLENPIRDIGSAIKSTRNIDFLYLILKDLFNVLLIEYTSETSVENISAKIIASSNI